MTDHLRELYQEVIIDHGRKPRNFGKCEHSTHSQEGYNPLCGDQLTIHLAVKNNAIQHATFEGAGCAISVASASLMVQAMIGKTQEQALALFEAFHSLIMGDKITTEQEKLLDKLNVLAGVREYPTRIKCATLAWHTLKGALAGDNNRVSTE